MKNCRVRFCALSTQTFPHTHALTEAYTYTAGTMEVGVIGSEYERERPKKRKRNREDI